MEQRQQGQRALAAASAKPAALPRFSALAVLYFLCFLPPRLDEGLLVEEESLEEAFFVRSPWTLRRQGPQRHLHCWILRQG